MKFTGRKMPQNVIPGIRFHFIHLYIYTSICTQTHVELAHHSSPDAHHCNARPPGYDHSDTDVDFIPRATLDDTHAQYEIGVWIRAGPSLLNSRSISPVLSFSLSLPLSLSLSITPSRRLSLYLSLSISISRPLHVIT